MNTMDFPEKHDELQPEHDHHPGIEENAEKKELLEKAKTVVHQRQKKKKKAQKIDWSAQGALILGGALFAAILLYAILGLYRHKQPQGRMIVHDGALLPTEVQYGGEKLPGKTFVGMEATRTDKNPELITEIKKIIEEGGMPSDVFENNIPPEMNIANDLSREFKIYQQNSGELERLREHFPFDDWKVDEKAIAHVSDILERVDGKRLQMRSMLNRKDVCFSFEFVQDPDYGEIPDTSAGDFIADYALLEEYAIARSLLEGKIEEATESLAYIFRLAQLAAEVPNPGVRARAAQVRLRALEVMQTVVFDPKFRESNLAYLHQMLREQLDYWTGDRVAWIGDRASGLKVYNLVLQYGLEAALEPEEIAELKNRELLDTVVKNLPQTLAHDQIFYLRSMQAIIDECDKPYYQRIATLNRIIDQIRSSQGTQSETVIAGFLFRGIREIMQLCAQDRSKCESAALALATSLKNSKNPADAESAKKSIETLTIDPLFGKNYEVRQILNDRDPKIDIVWVSYPGNLKPFRVPDYSKNP